MWPERAWIPRPPSFASAKSGLSARPFSCSSVFSAPAPRRKPSASIARKPSFGAHVVLLVAGRLELPVEGLAHDHPQGVAGGRAMAGGKHELVAVRMLRAPVIVAKAAKLRSGQVHRDVVRRIGERPAEVAGLRVIPEQGQGHARHEPDVLEPLFIFGVQQACARRCRLYAHLYTSSDGGRKRDPSKERGK